MTAPIMWYWLELACDELPGIPPPPKPKPCTCAVCRMGQQARVAEYAR